MGSRLKDNLLSFVNRRWFKNSGKKFYDAVETIDFICPIWSDLGNRAKTIKGHYFH